MKLIFLFKRKAGTTFEQFRDHYENNHAPLAVRLLPYFKTYKRNYIRHGEQYRPTGLGAKSDFDVVTELSFASRDDYERMLAALADRGILSQIVQDEERFMDRSPDGRLMFIVDEEQTPEAKLQEFAESRDPGR